MSFRSLSRVALFLQILCAALLPVPVVAQGNGSGMVVNTPLSGGLTRNIDITDVDIYIKGPDQKPLEGTALVTLTKMNGEFYKQGTAKNGYVRLNELAQSEYNIQVLAPGFTRITKTIDAHPRSGTLMTFTVQLDPAGEGVDAATDIEVGALPQKAQRALGKAIELLRANKAAEAKSSLETAAKIAPNSAEIQFVYGVYAEKVGQKQEAKAYWEKSIQLYPQHFRSLMSLSELLMAENRPADAIPYLERATRAEPSSWRAHAIAADAYLRQGANEKAIQQSERALELGHDRAGVVQRYIAAALAKSGDRQKALEVMETYVKDHPKDDDARKQLANLQMAMTQGNDANVAAPEALANEAALPLPSSWMPPDVDEKIPAVEPGAACQINDVLQRAGKRIEELVKNVDRFTANELVTHESVNKWGMLSPPEKRKFDYVVSVSEVAQGYLNVDEYRSVRNQSGMDFPGGIETHGLPAMVLIFHPYNVGSFDMTCEGLTKWNGGLAWQVHFRQRSDKPNRIRSYRIGLSGPAYPIAMKGRAWITSDTFEITRLETDLIAPVPEIRLRADHTAIEYGPVHFNKRNEDMWLPQTAEVYFDWRDRRVHRRHSFNNYLLFAVDDRQTVSNPNGGRDLVEKTDGFSKPKAADAPQSSPDSVAGSQAKPSNWLKIMVPAVFVTNQEKAVKFYTETLGLEKKTDELTANARKLTVALPGAQDGVELRLDSSELASMQDYQKAMYQSGTALTVFEVRDIEQEHARLRDLGVQFKMAPTKTGSGTVAVLDDTCGNWIQLVQKEVLASNNPAK